MKEKTQGAALDQIENELEILHKDMAEKNMAPTWKYISEFVSKEPKPPFRPWLWKWDDVLPLIKRSGELIIPERGAERRSMEHVNPDLKPYFSTSHTIATAFQLVQAGEHAPAHRHSAAAIRFAAKSSGGTVYTKVQGERLSMQENDLLLTPAWTWHEHGNETEHDIIWLDALDFPLVNMLCASVFEPGEGEVSPPKDDNYSHDRLGFYRPVGWDNYTESHPIMRYPWVDMKAALDSRVDEEGNPFDGILLEYVNPINSGPTLPTISCRAQLLRSNEHTKAHRSTTSTIYYVIEGSGTTIINGVEFDWAPGDVFVVPNWAWHEHRNNSEASYLFVMTDEPLMKTLGMYREQALEDGNQVVTGNFSA